MWRVPSHVRRVRCASSVPHFGLWIDGTWVESKQRCELLNPATQQLEATFACADEEDVHHAVSRASEAFRSGHWSAPALR